MHYFNSNDENNQDQNGSHMTLQSLFLFYGVRSIENTLQKISFFSHFSTVRLLATQLMQIMNMLALVI